jgi:hypothetical protein
MKFSFLNYVTKAQYSEVNTLLHKSLTFSVILLRSEVYRTNMELYIRRKGKIVGFEVPAVVVTKISVL